MVSAIVLAAGLSSRMGEHKMLTKLPGGKAMLSMVVEEIEKAEFFEIIVVSGREKAAIFSELQGIDLKLVYNPKYENGLSSSISAGVREMDDRARGLAVCLGDMPLIEEKEYRVLIHAFEEALDQDQRAILVPSFNGRRGNPVFFSSLYRQDVIANNYPEGCKSIVQRNSSHVREFEMSTGHVLVDIDTREDLVRNFNFPPE